uniref:IMP dehydrogenase n=1 Tax=Rhodnius prolixus TaxID=13249 RepID=T1ICF2_RHOPR
MPRQYFIASPHEILPMLRIAKEALTFDDVLLIPAHSTVLPDTADLTTQLTKTIRLNIPMLSAAMDTVTESGLAIALAQEGGIGFIHKNMSIERQAEEVSQVKRHESGVVVDPQTVTPTTTLREVKALTERNGFAGYPVVTDDNELVGIITGRDVRFVTDLERLVSAVMTPKDRLVTVREGEAREVVLQKMHEKRVEKALVVDGGFHLLGMITVKDFQKAERKPNACKDEHGRLRVGSAVGAGAGNEERVDALVAAGVDVLLIDSSHGHSEGVLQRIRETRAKYPDLQIIGGNVATGAGAKALAEAGVSAVKVGIGPGSICTTRIVTGVGVPQITAISDAVAALEGIGAGNGDEIGWNGRHFIAVAHPYVKQRRTAFAQRILNIAQQCAFRFDFDLSITKLTLAGAFYMSTQLHCHGLHAVAHTQHRHTGLEHIFRRARAVVLGGAFRATGRMMPFGLNSRICASVTSHAQSSQ